MPVNYSVKSVVFDLRNDTPKTTDRIYVDTNAWFWTVYTNVQFSPTPPHPNQTNEYPGFLKRVLNMGGQLHWCGLSLSELAHLIERTEYNIYCQSQPATLKPKEYRHNLPAERVRVAQEIQTAWEQVQSIASCVDVPAIEEAMTATALQEFAQLPLDGYDLFVIHALRESGVKQVVSDDGDFCCVPGISLFTTNQNVIDAARTQNRFRQR